ncbi:hypothetical protein ACFFSY_20270 [Paenibacillus aurantiacus]|uniref:Uncharacterized protein n=1 Tax=Paenibacillus aurantiacus TaxID=1936118 RepID=A0ABV5KSR5_9BACL
MIELRQLFKTYCNKEYSLEIKEFANVLRVDGDIRAWNFVGCQKLRINRKDKYITVDVGMPREKWEAQSEANIKRYLFGGIKDAIIIMINKLKKRR